MTCHRSTVNSPTTHTKKTPHPSTTEIVEFLLRPPSAKKPFESKCIFAINYQQPTAVDRIRWARKPVSAGVSHCTGICYERDNPRHMQSVSATRCYEDVVCAQSPCQFAWRSTKCVREWWQRECNELDRCIAFNLCVCACPNAPSVVLQ